MNQFKIRVSLRSKLLAILIILPVISLALYLSMAADLFQKDKVAYVFGSSATVSRGLATQMRMESQSIYENLRVVAEQFDFTSKEFNVVGQDLFKGNSRLQALIVYRRDESGQYVRQGQLVSPDATTATAFATDDALLNLLITRAGAAGSYLGEFTRDPDAINAAFRLGEANDPRQVIMIGLYRARDLMNAFRTTGNYSSFVVTRAGQIAIGSMDVVETDIEPLRHLLQNNVGGEGAAETTLSDGLSYLVSFSNVGLGDLIVVSKVDKKRALSAVQELIRRSLSYFVALIASTLLISVFVSSRLTSTITELFEATAKIAAGDFNVRVEPRSRDEVGGLAHSFNWMAAEVSRLMSETAEAARMEGELNTVRTVQETLFPPSRSQFGPINIAGHFEPASECGGDWWNYSRVGNQVYLWIGDATGHGAPAALITSAARSAAAVIEGLSDMTPARAMTILNRAIHQTSKGQIMMTFFIASIDLDQNTFTYASASHDPPYLLRAKDGKLVKKDLVPLNEVNGPRLGDQKDFVYEDKTIAFSPGDLLFLYTDGILDIQDPDGKKWGERAFLKSLVDSANSGESIEGKLTGVRSSYESFRGGSALIDDVTMVMCEFDKRVA